MKKIVIGLFMFLGFVVACALSLMVITIGVIAVSCLAAILVIGERLSFFEQKKIAEKIGKLPFCENEDGRAENIEQRQIHPEG